MLTQAIERLFACTAGLPDPLPHDPVPTLASWLDEARRLAHQPNPNAMALATSTSDGRPSARIVLCRAIEPATASLTFFTNYQSRKGGELDANPRAAAVFHWDHQDRQARVEGRIERVSAAESDAYFQARPLVKRLAAWASDQSRPMTGRLDLLKRVAEVAERFAINAADLLDPSASADVPRPPHWGGYRLLFDSVELWQGHAGRLHDRCRWERSGRNWSHQRLFP